MSKYERGTYRMLMGALILMSIIVCIEALFRETECCQKGAQFGFGLAVIALACVGWPFTPDGE